MMRRNPALFRLSASVALGAMLSSAALPAVAQPVAQVPPLPGVVQPDQPQGDPPVRVGRVARQSGAVSFRTAADTRWSAARPNFPVSTGDSLWTEPGAQTELEIAGGRVALSAQTEIDISALDGQGLRAVVAQGEIYVQLSTLAPNEVWSMQTPRGLVRLTAPGRYGIVIGSVEASTLVTVLEGSAEIEGPGLSIPVGANQTATLTGAGPFHGSVGPAATDAFLTARLNATRPRARPPSAIPSEVASMPGGEDLYNQGEWAEAPEYGQVWYPPVAADWVPYRDGSWAYVAPWGWTWVDNAPWGFAPFHYGRWARIHDRWGWVPRDERVARPLVYAPALVAFLGFAGAAAIAHRAVGWVPLGPREAYHPWYRASDGYVRGINDGHAKDLASTGGFANRAAASSVPARFMTGSRSLRTVARPVPEGAFATARPLAGPQLLRPTAGTFGVTPAVARQLNLPPGNGPRQFAPGPGVRRPEAGPAMIGPPGGVTGIPRVPGSGAIRVPIRVQGAPPPVPIPDARPEGVQGPRVVSPLRPEGAVGRAPVPDVVNGPGRSGPPPMPAVRPAVVPPPREVRPETIQRATPPPMRVPDVVRPAVIPHPPAPAFREQPLPRVVTPEAARAVAPPPRMEAPRVMAPPPRIEQPRVVAPPPRMEQARPAAPQHVEPVHPAGGKRPGEH